MKIAHLVSTFPPVIGGMGNVCKNEARLLAENGHDVTVFTLNYPDTHYDDTIYPFAIKRLRPFLRFGNGGFVPQLAGRLSGFNIVHLHYPFYGLILPDKNIPLVVTYHMDGRPRGALKKILQKIYDSLFSPGIFSKARRVIAVDREYFEQSKFGKLIDAGKAVEISNGADLKLFSPLAGDLKDVNLEQLSGKKIFLYVGNPMPLKRLDLALQAIKILNDPDARLVVVGGGYDLEDYKKLARDLEINDKVVFVGECPNDVELADYYNAAACLVMPSERESFSLVIVEAMACGLPVIGTDIPGVRNRISPGADGFLFAKGDARDLADKMKIICALPPEKLKEMGRAGREKIVKNYSWELHIQKLEALYREVANGI